MRASVLSFSTPSARTLEAPTPAAIASAATSKPNPLRFIVTSVVAGDPLAGRRQAYSENDSQNQFYLDRLKAPRFHATSQQ